MHKGEILHEIFPKLLEYRAKYDQQGRYCYVQKLVIIRPWYQVTTLCNKSNTQIRNIYLPSIRGMVT